MENYKYRPLAGLLSIKKEEISDANVLNTLSYAEEKIKPSPKGSAMQLAFLFYLIKILKDAGLSFYVKGGLIQHYYLEERARPTYDLDIIIKEDSDAFVEKLNSAFETNQDSLSLKIKKYEVTPANNLYYYNSFNIEIEVKENDLECARLYIDGVVDSHIYSKIKPLTYEMPEIIAPNTNFKGVPIEYVMAEKIIAITNELVRPFKHLVDIYSLMNLDINVDSLKEYLKLIIDNDDQIRVKLEKEVKPYIYQVKADKIFAGSYIFTVLQAGYTISYSRMIGAVNAWLAKLF